ncbi:unnamed protein product [Lymnaea stagnalis]|uniref:Uncharacterized protein n=1 Tax=Lymnaea stagnalis TaxID=6523 RepID=A0AAV2HDW9_LYMST
MLSVKFPKSDPKNCHNKECVGILTDDEVALDMLKSIRKLPTERYQSVSVILEDCRPLPIDRYHPTYQLGTFAITKHLQPLCSNTGRRPSESRGYPQGPHIRVPPVPHDDDQANPEDQPVGQPHKGVIYPQSYANKPPYSCPGYEEQGIKQPTGVIKLPKVPAGRRKGIVNGIEMMVPAWVSPLYKPYGIGGPYGPNGPFYSVPSELIPKTPDWKTKLWPVFQKSTKPVAPGTPVGLTAGENKPVAPGLMSRWKSFFNLFSRKKTGPDSEPQTTPATEEGADGEELDESGQPTEISTAEQDPSTDQPMTETQRQSTEETQRQSTEETQWQSTEAPEMAPPQEGPVNSVNGAMDQAMAQSMDDPMYSGSQRAVSFDDNFTF